MAKVVQIDVYVDVADEMEGAQVLRNAVGSHQGELAFQAGAVEHDHPIAVSHYQLDEQGQPRKDAAGKPVLNALRDEQDKIVTDRKGRPQFPPPLPGKLRVWLSYR